MKQPLKLSDCRNLYFNNDIDAAADATPPLEIAPDGVTCGSALTLPFYTWRTPDDHRRRVTVGQKGLYLRTIDGNVSTVRHVEWADIQLADLESSGAPAELVDLVKRRKGLQGAEGADV